MCAFPSWASREEFLIGLNKLENNLHYYKFNISDWALHTAHLNVYEESIYFRLINHYYDTEKPIPLELSPIIRRLRLNDHTGDLDTILNEFFIETENGFTHKRCDEVLKEYRKTNKKNKVNGAKGGRPAKAKALKVSQTKPSGLIKETQPKPKDKPNYELLTNNQEPITTNQELSVNTLDQSQIDQETLEFCFNQFWESGIRKVNKKKAKVLFLSVLKKNSKPNGVTAYDFTTRLEQDIKARINAQQMGFSEMHPTTYLNGERWTDEIKEAANGQHQQHNQQRISTVEQSLRETAAYGEQLRLRREELQSRRGDDETMGLIDH
jgi:uncharacterized protein YdaU (DUF1376 family)